MDISGSQFNSGSESGWTHYLDQSSVSEKHLHWRSEVVEYEGKGARIMEEEEEDLSMVSDASSGPPHYHEEDYQGYCVNWYDPSTSQYNKESEKKKKKNAKEYGRNQQPSPLDDTASSPVVNCPQKKASFSVNGEMESALHYSECLPASKLKKKPNKFQKHFSFFGRSHGGQEASEEPGDP